MFSLNWKEIHWRHSKNCKNEVVLHWIAAAWFILGLDKNPEENKEFESKV